MSRDAVEGYAVPAGRDYTGAEANGSRLPGADLDPRPQARRMRLRTDDSAQPMDSSSSSAGMDKILPGPDDDSQPQGRKRRKAGGAGTEHHETTAEDIEVGKYEMDNHN